MKNIFIIVSGLLLLSVANAQSKTEALVSVSTVSFMQNDTGTIVSTLFLTINTDKEIQYPIGTYVGDTVLNMFEDSPKNTKIGVSMFWAGTGKNYAFAFDGTKLTVYEQINDEEFVGKFKLIKTITIPTKKYTIDEENVKYLDIELGASLSIKNRPSFNPTVVALQAALARLGYESVGPADGYFGPNTEKALKEFQKKNKLKVDGIAGKEVWQILDLEISNN